MPAPRFITSVSNLADCPNLGLPEVAMIGRSNVGKSSLINLLCGQGNLARTSKTPGKTQTLNFYDSAKGFVIVDLPGYGYAKVSKSRRFEWDRNLVEFLLERDSLKHVFVLVDASIETQKSDLEFLSWLKSVEKSFSIVRTKIDKAKQQEIYKLQRNFELDLSKLDIVYNQLFLVSSKKFVGQDKILDFIRQL
jgi:GTP-binding protein